MNQQEFIAKATATHPGKFDYSITQFCKLDARIWVRCLQHGPFQILPFVHLRKPNGSCPACDGRLISANDFIERSKKQHGERYSYAVGHDLKWSDKISIECRDHGKFIQMVGSHLSGCGCPKCSKTYVRSPQEWEEAAKQKHGNQYSYSITKWHRATTKIEIVCPVHGSFWQLTFKHINNGSGCPQCANDKLRMPFNDFIQRAGVVQNNKYIYPEQEFKNVKQHINIICPKHGVFTNIAEQHLLGAGCWQCHCVNASSKPQRELFDFVSQHVSAVIGDKQTIPPFEIDVLVPNVLGLELHGLYWHSFNAPETTQERHKHLQKFEMCRVLGLPLLQIWESEWRDKRNICESIILGKLNKHIKLAARKTTFKSISSMEATVFLNTNHLLGDTPLKEHCFGLFHDNELVMVAVFCSHTRNKISLTRMAGKCGLSVVGGASKLLKHSIQSLPREWTGCDLVSFSDRRYSTGNLYQRLGFMHDGSLPPSYWYTDSKNVLNKRKFRKDKLSRLFEDYKSDQTEAENMFAHGYRRLWDAGYDRWKIVNI